VAQFQIGSDGTLTPMSPATVADDEGIPTSVTIAADGTTAYVLSSCGASQCGGQIEQYAVGTAGALASTGTAPLIGSNVTPIALLTGAAGPSAYLLAAQVSSSNAQPGVLDQYAIGAMDSLTADTPMSPPISAGGPVAEAIQGSDLYVLTALGLLSAQGLQSDGGNVDHYMIDSTGLLTRVDTTAVAAGQQPRAMIAVPAH